MAKTKQDVGAEESTAPHRLSPHYAFAVGEHVTGPGIAGKVVTQDGPWTVTIQQSRGHRITTGTKLLSKAKLASD